MFQQLGARAAPRARFVNVPLDRQGPPRSRSPKNPKASPTGAQVTDPARVAQEVRGLGADAAPAAQPEEVLVDLQAAGPGGAGAQSTSALQVQNHNHDHPLYTRHVEAEWRPSCAGLHGGGEPAHPRVFPQQRGHGLLDHPGGSEETRVQQEEDQPADTKGNLLTANTGTPERNYHQPERGPDKLSGSVRRDTCKLPATTLGRDTSPSGFSGERFVQERDIQTHDEHTSAAKRSASVLRRQTMQSATLGCGRLHGNVCCQISPATRPKKADASQHAPDHNGASQPRQCHS